MPRVGLVAQRITVKGPRGSYQAIRYKKPTGSLQMFAVSNEDVDRLKQALDGVGQDRASTLAQFFRSNRKYVRNIAVSVARNILPEKVLRSERGQEGINDATQAGEIGLWEALRDFDPAKGTKFGTFATTIIRRKAADIFKIATRKWTKELSVEEAQQIPPGRAAVMASPEENVLTKMVLERLYDKLGEKERTVAKMRAAGYRFQEIATATGSSEENIRAIFMRKVAPVARQVARKASQGTPPTLLKATTTRGSAAGVVIDIEGRAAVRLLTGGVT